MSHEKDGDKHKQLCQALQWQKKNSKINKLSLTILTMVHLYSNALLNEWNQSSWVYPTIWCYTSIKFQERNLALKNKDKQKS